MSALRYVLEMLDDDGAAVARVAVAPAWRAVIESVGFEAARRTRGAPVTALGRGSVTPVWDVDLGAPHVGALRVDVPLDGDAVYSKQLPISHLAGAAESAAALLADQGRLPAAPAIRFRVLALPGDAAPAPAAGLDVEEVAAPLPVAEEPLAALLGGGTRLLGPHREDDVPVVVDGRVAGDAITRALASPDIETGALLAGYLRRDPASGDLFVHVTAGLAARHTEATADKLTFTAETWAAARAALARRDRGELLLGWQHHHRAFCRPCPAERRAACPLRDNFFSADDVHLHGAVFDRAFHVALLVSLDVERPPALSLYGWRDGAVRRRGFYLTGDRGEPAAEREAT